MALLLQTLCVSAAAGGGAFPHNSHTTLLGYYHKCDVLRLKPSCRGLGQKDGHPLKMDIPGEKLAAYPVSSSASDAAPEAGPGQALRSFCSRTS